MEAETEDEFEDDEPVDFIGASWVVASDNGFTCQHCSTRIELVMPIRIMEFVHLSRDFEKRHAECPAPVPL